MYKMELMQRLYFLTSLKLAKKFQEKYLFYGFWDKKQPGKHPR